MEILQDRGHKREVIQTWILLKQTALTLLTEYDTKQFHASNREHSKELLSIPDDSNSNLREKKQCPP